MTLPLPSSHLRLRFRIIDLQISHAEKQEGKEAPSCGGSTCTMGARGNDGIWRGETVVGRFVEREIVAELVADRDGCAAIDSEGVSGGGGGGSGTRGRLNWGGAGGGKLWNVEVFELVECLKMQKGGAASSVAAWFLVAMVVVLVVEVHETTAVTCNPVALSPCMSAMTGSSQPSAECCSKLREQQPCFCGYMKNPMLKPYVDSPNAKKVAATCGIAAPRC
ncbi:hypothetical protein BUALT_Bualt11G0058000 [Buddleja alternifolia]|uniref:Bifunctional inhibitor/plant lipid transfer protein/seed storage helical domain-containing protein n=1 Tax=Buddleja alternifolia TaxID=168488 RepID=A0AAV6WSU8_9LAMI|nr:hypothetical protein BUALT_Bualt11G0058000 [Buddleja alternifolia]